MKLINLTEQKQEVHFIDGNATAVKPKKTVFVDEKKMYAEELKRVLSIFRVVEDKKSVSSPTRESSLPSNKNEKAGDKDNGGTK